jgi:hypothetical protein
MRFAKSIMLKRSGSAKTIFSSVFILSSIIVFAQGNSPYSRYGLGDIYSNSNISTRSMGGLSSGYSSPYSVNFNNPASYSQFQTWKEKRSNKITYGRVVLDAGMSFDTRSLIAPNTTERFTSSDALFSYLQVGLPIKKNWGLVFGIRPLTRIGYKINREEYLMNPAIPGDTIEKATTQFEGSGGSYLPSIGTGFGFDIDSNNYVSFGFNVGYLFGNKDNSTFRNFSQDTLLYYPSDHTTSTSFHNPFFNAGMQYQLITGRNTVFRLGVSGNWKQTLKASQDILRQTYTRGANGEELQIDSVYQKRGVSGKVIFPATYQAGFVVEHINKNRSGWLLGADLTQGKWSQYRFYGQADSVQDNWMLHIGAQVYPKSKNNYFSNVVYRFGFFTGPDYVKVGQELPQYGVSFGLQLPLTRNRFNPNEVSLINLALEYIKRGDNDNQLKENLFRISVGLNFTDLWFGKKKYE